MEQLKKLAIASLKIQLKNLRKYRVLTHIFATFYLKLLYCTSFRWISWNTHETTYNVFELILPTLDSMSPMARARAPVPLQPNSPASRRRQCPPQEQQQQSPYTDAYNSSARYSSTTSSSSTSGFASIGEFWQYLFYVSQGEVSFVYLGEDKN